MSDEPVSRGRLGNLTTVDLWDLEITDRNRDKMHANGVSVKRAFEVLEGSPRALPNHSPDGAPVLVVGPDASGTFVTLPVDPALDYGVWRPRTAYPSKDSEISRYRKMRER